MSIKILSDVLDYAPAKGGELLFLIALADQASDEDRCAWPGGEKLARRARCDERSVYRHAQKLVAKNVIEQVPDDERPERYRRQPGRETTCWRILPMKEWLNDTPDNLSPLSEVADCHPTPDLGVTPPLTPVSLEPSVVIKGSRKNPRATLWRKGTSDDHEPTATPGELPDDSPVASEPLVAPKRRNATSLAIYFRRWTQRAYPMSVESVTGEGPLARNIRVWRNEGVAIELVAEAMELFMNDQRFHRDGVPLWKSFVNAFPDLANRVRGNQGLPPAKSVERITLTDQEKENEPVTDYKAWKAKKLREAGRIA